MRCKWLIRWGVVNLLVLFNLSTPAAEPEPGNWEGMKQMMSPEEFQAAGLDKLSAEELHKLNLWMLQFLAHESQQIVHTDKAIRKLQQAPVRRRVAGHFPRLVWRYGVHTGQRRGMEAAAAQSLRCLPG